MDTRIQIMMPTLPDYSEKVCCRGFIYSSANVFKLYITELSNNIESVKKKRKFRTNQIFGYFDGTPTLVNPNKNNFFVLDSTVKLKIKELILNGLSVDVSNCVMILYDQKSIVNSEIIWDIDENFSQLQKLVLCENNISLDTMCPNKLVECPTWLKASMIIQHIVNYINTFHWALKTLTAQKKITIKHGNLLLSILMDLLLGYLALEFVKNDKKELSTTLMGMFEKLINMLYSLLKWLMGAPAGLKLNNAFNKMLGKYFSYHVQLWWLFLDVSGDKLGIILDIYHYMGYFGLTFQAAIISDIICIATFHSYCIYVYAARMFNIQISGLVALLRFFVGRKYNPLRRTIDSCEYTNQELFVGTVAFTILLLLLPTTTMYYIVFTLFRMLSLMMQYALAKLVYLLHTLPLYVICLWIRRSPRVAGNILLEVIDSTETLTLKLRIMNKSIFYLVKKFRPPVEVPKQLQWADIISNVFKGKQLI